MCYDANSLESIRPVTIIKMHPPGLLEEPYSLPTNLPVNCTSRNRMEQQYKVLISTLSHIPEDTYIKDPINGEFEMTQGDMNYATKMSKRRMEAANPNSSKQSPNYQVSQKQRFSGIKPSIEQLNRNFMSIYYVEQCASIRAQDQGEFWKYMTRQLSSKQDKVQRRIKRLLEIERGQVLLGEFIEQASSFSFTANEALILNIKSILQPDSFAFPLLLQIPEPLQSKLGAQILEFMRSFFFQTMDLSWLLNMDYYVYIKVILSGLQQIAAEMIALSVQKSAPEALLIHSRLMEVLKSLSSEQCASYYTQKFLLHLLKLLSKETSLESRRYTKAIASFWCTQPDYIHQSYRYVESIDLDEIVKKISGC